MLRVRFGLGLAAMFLALVKALKMSDVSRLREALVWAVEVDVVLPDELGRERASFLTDDSGDVAAFPVEVGLEIWWDLLASFGSMVGGGGRRPVLRLTALLTITP
jgi:hypothetical protein